MNEYNKIITKINNDEFFPIYILVGDENYFADNIIKLLIIRIKKFNINKLNIRLRNIIFIKRFKQINIIN